MKPHADSAHRRNATGRKIIGEQLRGLHPQRIGITRAARQPGYGRHIRGYLSAVNDHHQQFAGADERDRGPRGHSRTGKTMPRP